MTNVEPWYQLSPSALKVPCIGFMGGASTVGLGLAIARGFAEAHNGTLEVANTKAGATFTLALPRRHEERTLPVRVP